MLMFFKFKQGINLRNTAQLHDFGENVGNRSVLLELKMHEICTYLGSSFLNKPSLEEWQ